MNIFITGGTGYIGSYVITELLRESGEDLSVLVRAESEQKSRKRLWQALQLHMDFDEFSSHLVRIRIYRGDVTQPWCGLSGEDQDELIESIDSVIHGAASLNRKSAKSCMNVNLRGTLHVTELARAAHEKRGLKRFSYISTAAIAGKRQDEVVSEDNMIEWDRSDYDTYARSKKFGEYMIRQLLPDVPTTMFRLSIIMGDSRFPETTQFSMIQAFASAAYALFLPLRKDHRLDICPADYVGRAIRTIHLEDNPAYDSYNLSAGEDSETYGQIMKALHEAGHKLPTWFVPFLFKPYQFLAELLMRTPRKWGIAPYASLMKVFFPYLNNNTVFDNSRIVDELGEKPVPFSVYAYDLLQFSIKNRFIYPYLPWLDKPSLSRKDSNNTSCE